MTPAEKVKALREAKGLSQEQLAERLGYPTAAMVKKVENNRPVSYQVLAQFAEALDTTLEDLLGKNEEAEAPAPAASPRQRLLRLVGELTDAQVDALLCLLER